MVRVGNTYFIEHVARFQKGSATRDTEMRRVADEDASFYGTTGAGAVRQIGVQDPGSAGVDRARAFKALMKGDPKKGEREHPCSTERETGDKKLRADGFAKEAGKLNVKILKGSWNEAFLRELEKFTGEDDEFDDIVDASAGSYNRLSRRRELHFAVG